MNKNDTGVIAYGLFFLFFIQMAGVLVESIYILDLMNTSLDAKVLGMLFFFSPALLFPFRGKLPSRLVLLGVGALIICRGSLPYLETSGRLLAAGIGVAALLLLLPHLFTARIKTETNTSPGWLVAAGLGVAVCLSVYLRTLNFGVDYSLTPAGGWIGGLLGLALAWALTNPDWEPSPEAGGSSEGVTPAVLGMFLILTLVYFAFSAPSVIARWVDGNYTLVVLLVSLQAAAWMLLMLVRPALPARIPRIWLLAWNLAFMLAITATCLAQRVAFPLSPQASAVVSSSPGWLQLAPLYLMLLTYPVILLDFQLFFNQISQSNPAPRQLLPGLLLGCLALLALAFASIFSNVWGYIDPVSTPFRNMFWLPFFLAAAGISVIVWVLHGKAETFSTGPAEISIFTPGIFMAAMVIGSVVSALQSGPVQSRDLNKHSLVVMTYNIQEANDGFAQRSLDRQLAVIERVSPDILALQESDSARISLNNDDIVRYFAGKLGYYSYYGPSTVTGTFGTAILSKYPLQNVRSAFSYSNVDEIGSAEAEIEVAGQSFTIYNVHPDGSETAVLAFTRSLLERSAGKSHAIILGDFNMRDTDKGYAQVAAEYTNAWVSIYPSKISADGIDMSGSNRIDHIFFSRDLSATSATYLLPPASASDHPVHWAEITWQK